MELNQLFPYLLIALGGIGQLLLYGKSNPLTFMTSQKAPQKTGNGNNGGGGNGQVAELRERQARLEERYGQTGNLREDLGRLNELVLMNQKRQYDFEDFTNRKFERIMPAIEALPRIEAMLTKILEQRTSP